MVEEEMKRKQCDIICYTIWNTFKTYEKQYFSKLARLPPECQNFEI